MRANIYTHIPTDSKKYQKHVKWWKKKLTKAELEKDDWDVLEDKLMNDVEVYQVPLFSRTRREVVRHIQRADQETEPSQKECYMTIKNKRDIRQFMGYCLADFNGNLRKHTDNLDRSTDKVDNSLEAMMAGNFGGAISSFFGGGLVAYAVGFPFGVLAYLCGRKLVRHVRQKRYFKKVSKNIKEYNELDLLPGYSSIHGSFKYHEFDMIA